MTWSDIIDRMYRASPPRKFRIKEIIGARMK
jgi:hypothetical protein